MPRWDDNDVWHPKVINKTLQQINDYENNNKYCQKPKNLRAYFLASVEI